MTFSPLVNASKQPTESDTEPASEPKATLTATPKQPKRKGPTGVPDEALPDLIKLVHGSTAGIGKLVDTFVNAHSGVTKAAALRLVKDTNFSVRELRAPYKKERRFVVTDVLEKYGLTDLPLPEAGPAAEGLISDSASISTPNRSQSPVASLPVAASPVAASPKLSKDAASRSPAPAAAADAAAEGINKAASMEVVEDRSTIAMTGSEAAADVPAAKVIEPASKEDANAPMVEATQAEEAVTAKNLASSTAKNAAPAVVTVATTAPATSATAVSASSEAGNAVTDGMGQQPWSRHISPTGVPYYFNRVTNESSWVEPAEYRAAVEAGLINVKPASKLQGPKLSKEEREQRRLAKLEANLREKKMLAAEREAKRAMAKAAKDAEKMRIAEEREAKRAAEKAARDAKKEEERKAKEAKRELERKAREAERIRKEQEKIRLAAERKAKLEEARAAKEAEKQRQAAERAVKKEAERLQREAQREQEQRKRKAKAKEEERKKRAKLGISKSSQNFFAKLVVKKEVAKPEPTTVGKFMEFDFNKKNTKVAPEIRVEMANVSTARIDSCFDTTVPIDELKASGMQRWKKAMTVARRKTKEAALLPASPVPVSSDASEDNGGSGGGRRATMKLLLFHTDVRPPYYGTYRKRSTILNGRRVHAKDLALFDYEYDSEAEWDPEDCESGDECVSGDEDEDAPAAEEQDPCAADEDNWMVPHGYLSDDEVGDNEVEDGLENDRKELQEVQHKRGKKYTVGCKWGRDAERHSKLGQFMMTPLVATPIDIFKTPSPKAKAARPDAPPKVRPGPTEVPVAVYPALIRLVHGSLTGVEQLATELLEMCKTDAACKDVTRAAITRKMKDVAFCVKEIRSPYRRARRFVHPEILEAHNLADLVLPDPIPEKAMKPAKERGSVTPASPIENIMKAFETQNAHSWPWSRHYDPNSKSSYYFNEQTKVSTWTRPTELG